MNAISLPATGSVPSTTVTAINDAFTKALNVSELSVQQIASGALSTSAAMAALETLNRTLAVASSALERGASVSQSSITASIESVADIIAALQAKGGLTSTDTGQIASIVASTLGTSDNLITGSSTAAQITAVVNASAEVLARAISAGAPLNSAIADAANALTSRVMETSLPALAARLGITLNAANATQVRTQLAANSVLLDSALRNALPIPVVATVDQNAIIATLTGRGVSAQDAQRIATSLSGSFSNPTGAGIEGQNSGTAITAISSAFGANSVTIDAATGRVTVPGTSGTLSLQVTGMRLVPASFPSGVSKLPDGRMVAIQNGVAVELAPTPRDVTGFAAAVEGAGFDTSFRSNGTVGIALGGGQHFSGAFAFDNIGRASGECGALSIGSPSGSVNSADYAFKINCASGVVQRVVPFVGNGTFYAAVSGEGLKVDTNRDTGIVSIPGVGNFKPSFFVQPLTTSDQTFLNQNQISNGLSFRAGDFNADGRVDYEMIDASGKQILYGTP